MDSFVGPGPIIDVEPVGESRDRKTSAQAAGAGAAGNAGSVGGTGSVGGAGGAGGTGSYTPPSFGKKAAKAQPADAGPSASAGQGLAADAPASPEFRAPSFGAKQPQPGEGKAPSTVSQVAGGAVQTAVGGAVMAAGIPMLVLPGPGMATIAGGAAIASGGIKKMLGKDDQAPAAPAETSGKA